MNESSTLPTDRPGGYNIRDFDDPQDFPPEFQCRCCGGFNELHASQGVCGECQDILDEDVGMRIAFVSCRHSAPSTPKPPPSLTPSANVFVVRSRKMATEENSFFSFLNIFFVEYFLPAFFCCLDELFKFSVGDRIVV